MYKKLSARDANAGIILAAAALIQILAVSVFA